eukprot:3385221-Karenia_brevis.AAC.1
MGNASPGIQELARELKAALMPRPRGNSRSGGTRKPEWLCGKCATTNFMDRPCCRRCSTEKGALPGASTKHQKEGGPAKP